MSGLTRNDHCCLGIVSCSKEDMLQDWGDWSERWQGLLKLIPEPKKWALHQLVPLPTYAKSRVALIGDAAHSMLPHQGAGAGTALEDGYVLSQLLTSPTLTVREAIAGLQAYSQTRQPRGNKILTTSWECGEVYEFADAERIGLDRDKMVAWLGEKYQWIWKHDPLKEVEEARQLMADLVASSA